MEHLFIAALTAFLAAIVLTWLVRHTAQALGVLDRPDGVRKLHRQPIPLLGGVGVFGAWLIGMLACQFLEQGSRIADGRWIEDGESRIDDYQQPSLEPQSSTLDPVTSLASRSSINGFRRALFLAAIVVLVW